MKYFLKIFYHGSFVYLLSDSNSYFDGIPLLTSTSPNISSDLTLTFLVALVFISVNSSPKTVVFTLHIRDGFFFFFCWIFIYLRGKKKTRFRCWIVIHSISGDKLRCKTRTKLPPNLISLYSKNVARDI